MATILRKGHTYSSGDAVTANNLNNLVDQAEFVEGPGKSTDDRTLEVHQSGYLQVKDGGITSAKLASDAITVNVIQDGTISNEKITNNTIEGGKLVDGTITSTQLADDAVTSDKLATDSVGSDALSATGVTAGTYTSPTIVVDDDGRITSATNGQAVPSGQWQFLSTPRQIQTNELTGTFTRDVKVCDYTDVPADARYLMFVYYGHQGYLDVFKGHEGYTRVATIGDNADGERLFILENIQYPVTVSQNGGGSEGPLTRGGLVPDSTSHSNMVPLHHMNFRFGDANDDGPSRHVYLRIIAFKY